MDKDKILELCKYERLMMISHGIDCELGKEELRQSINRLINYIGRKRLSILLKCEKEEVDFVLRKMIISNPGLC